MRSKLFEHFYCPQVSSKDMQRTYEKNNSKNLVDTEQTRDLFEFHPFIDNTIKEEVSDLPTHAIKDHVAINKEDYSRFLDDCSTEVIDVGSLEYSQLFVHDNLEEFDIENKLDVSELLSQEMNDIMIVNGEIELDNKKLEEMEDLKHAYVLQGKETSAAVIVPKDTKVFNEEFNDMFPMEI
ncbi:hypothetical protein TorRG33x02_340170 [Trema orientale]|uniref:Uncharacterized protein n=1 Tax=Trema orientale TaxID=63057 RepID=A0A2P5AVG6_TREOI|nr:hypothetical protein TorRG33x02_340170 [Trema orientale]